jgi:hypothetical protein
MVSPGQIKCSVLEAGTAKGEGRMFPPDKNTDLVMGYPKPLCGPHAKHSPHRDTKGRGATACEHAAYCFLSWVVSDDLEDLSKAQVVTQLIKSSTQSKHVLGDEHEVKFEIPRGNFTLVVIDTEVLNGHHMNDDPSITKLYGKHAVQRILSGEEGTHYPAHFSFQFPGTGNGVSDSMQHAAHSLMSYSEEHHGSKATVRKRAPWQ